LSGSNESELGKSPFSFRHVLSLPFVQQLKESFYASKSGRWRIDSMTVSLTAVVSHPELTSRSTDLIVVTVAIAAFNGRSKNWRPSLRRDALIAAVCRSSILNSRRRIKGW
jgi:hypothetical protein